MLSNTDMTLEFIKLGVAVGLIALGYVVGRTGLTQTITDIKTDISNIKNWIHPSAQVSTVATPVITQTTSPSTATVVDTTSVKLG